MENCWGWISILLKGSCFQTIIFKRIIFPCNLESWLFNLDAKIARIVLKTKFLINLFYVLVDVSGNRSFFSSNLLFLRSLMTRSNAEERATKGSLRRGGWECRMGKNQLGEESRAKRTKLARTLRYVTVAIDVWEAVIIGSARREIIARERGQELVLVCTIRLYN